MTETRAIQSLWVRLLVSQDLEHSTWDIASPNDVANKRVLMHGSSTVIPYHLRQASAGEGITAGPLGAGVKGWSI